MPRMLRTVGRTAAVAGTASATAGRVQRRQQGKWAERDQATQQEQASQQEAVAQQQAPPPDDPMAKLTELAKLQTSASVSPRPRWPSRRFEIAESMAAAAPRQTRAVAVRRPVSESSVAEGRPRIPAVLCRCASHRRA